MSLPIIVLAGESGAGKDTVASIIKQTHQNVAVVALADPMKRFLHQIFGFEKDALWGSSEKRNEVPTDWPTTPGQEMGELWSQFTDNMYSRYGDRTSEIRFLQDLGLHSPWSLDDWFLSQMSEVFREGKLTPRLALTSLGTGWGRSIDPDLWVNYAKKVALKLLCGGYTYTPEGGLVEDGEVPPAGFVVISDGRFPNEIAQIKAIGGHAWKIVRPDNSTNTPSHVSENVKLIPDSFFDVIIENPKVKPGTIRYSLGWKVNSVMPGAIKL